MLDSLRHFLLLVEHGTFRAAAEHAHLSQPAVSASIQRLEEFVGVRLLHRGRRGARPTAAGDAFLPSARAVWVAVEEGKRAALDIAELRAGEVTVGAGATACTYLLPAALARFRKRHPHVRILLLERTTAEAIDALARGELDLAIVSELEQESVVGDKWRDDRLILVAGPTLEDVEHAPHLTFRQGATTRTIFDRVFPDAEIAMELGSIAAVKGNVRAGIGVALVSENAVEEDLRRGKMVEVPHPQTPIPREFRILHRGLERLPPAAAALRELLLDGV